MSGMDFLTVVLIAFALFMALAGIFTAWFGSGKSRLAGFLMLIIGVAVGAVWTFLCLNGTIDVAIGDVLLSAVIDVAAVLIGGIVAVAIFLIAILKS